MGCLMLLFERGFEESLENEKKKKKKDFKYVYPLKTYEALKFEISRNFVTKNSPKWKFPLSVPTRREIIYIQFTSIRDHGGNRAMFTALQIRPGENKFISK